MGKTKVYFDTEFTGLHQKTTLVSIGLISECGKRFYAELMDYDKEQIDGWLQTNIIDNLYLDKTPYVTVRKANGSDITHYGDTGSLRDKLTEWFEQFFEVEIWSDCLSYDWVLFNEIFGHAFNIPKNVYYIPFDISTLFKEKNIDPDISREEFAFPDGIPEDAKKHNAMWDALVIRACHDKLKNI